jgi:hypothetical protein
VKMKTRKVRKKRKKKMRSWACDFSMRMEY